MPAADAADAASPRPSSSSIRTAGSRSVSTWIAITSRWSCSIARARCARASREVAFALPDDVEQFFRKGVGKLLAKVGIGRDRLVGIGVALPDDMPRAALP